MAQVFRSKNRNGRSVQIVVYDLQGTVLPPQEFIEALEGKIEEFLESHPFGKSVAVSTNVE